MKFDSLKKEYVVLLIEYFSLTLRPNNKSKVMQDVNRLIIVLVEQKKGGSAMLVSIMTIVN